MAKTLLACQKSRQSKTFCKIRLVEAFRKATASNLLADDKEEGIQKVRLAIQAAKALLNNNLKAAKELNKRARKKAEGKARFLRRLLANDELKPDDVTKAAGEIVRADKYVDADNEEEKQKISGEELEDSRTNARLSGIKRKLIRRNPVVGYVGARVHGAMI